MSDILQITVAIDSEEGAHKIAELLVEKRLAASCWVSGPITSRYWWKGVVEQAQEWVCTIKTHTDLYSEVEQAIKEVHPYEVPGILATQIVTGSQDYFDWVKREAGSGHPSDQTSASKEQLIQELIEAHEKLITAASAAYERGARQTGDMWGPREILAHVAGWEAMAVARTPRIVAGMAPIKYASAAQHAMMDNAINSTVLTMIGNQSFEAICETLHQTYQRDVQMLTELDDALFVPDGYIFGRSKAAIEHCYEHAQALERM